MIPDTSGYQIDCHGITCLCSSHPYSNLMLCHLRHSLLYFITKALYLLTLIQEEGWVHKKKIFWEKERHIHITFIRVYCYNSSVLLVTLVHCLLYLIYKLNFIIGVYREIIIYIRFGTSCGFRHELGVLKHLPHT